MNASEKIRLIKDQLARLREHEEKYQRQPIKVLSDHGYMVEKMADTINNIARIVAGGF